MNSEVRRDPPQYRVLLIPEGEDDGAGWIAEIPELPGCMVAADSISEALDELADAKKAWMKIAEEDGAELPEPIPSELEYSGKFTLRIPRSLHRQLVFQAQAEGVSLNQYASHILSHGVGTGPPRVGRRPCPAGVWSQ